MSIKTVSDFDTNELNSFAFKCSPHLDKSISPSLRPSATILFLTLILSFRKEKSSCSIAILSRVSFKNLTSSIVFLKLSKFLEGTDNCALIPSKAM